MPVAATAGQEVAVGASGASTLATAAFVATASAAAASVAVAEASVAGPCSGTSSEAGSGALDVVGPVPRQLPLLQPVVGSRTSQLCRHSAGQEQRNQRMEKPW